MWIVSRPSYFFRAWGLASWPCSPDRTLATVKRGMLHLELKPAKGQTMGTFRVSSPIDMTFDRQSRQNRCPRVHSTKWRLPVPDMLRDGANPSSMSPVGFVCGVGDSFSLLSLGISIVGGRSGAAVGSPKTLQQNKHS